MPPDQAGQGRRDHAGLSQQIPAHPALSTGFTPKNIFKGSLRDGHRAKRGEGGESKVQSPKSKVQSPKSGMARSRFVQPGRSGRHAGCQPAIQPTASRRYRGTAVADRSYSVSSPSGSRQVKVSQGAGSNPSPRRDKTTQTRG